MKIIITGHTSGIGLSLYNKLKSLNYTVIGYSRSTGHDISYENVRSHILSQPFDLFVNNAYHEVGQNKLLEELLKINKPIINISSNIVNINTIQFTPEIQKYRNVKETANKLINAYKGNAPILNVLPGLVKTNFYLGGDLLKYGMDPDYVADIIISKLGTSGELIIEAS